METISGMETIQKTGSQVNHFDFLPSEIDLPMRLAIVTGVWRRPEIFEMFAEGVKHLKSEFQGKLEIIVCVAGSEGNTSRSMVISHKDFFYTEVPNIPLGKKMNSACGLARKLSPDYCLMVGSDDIIGSSLMHRYYAEMQKKTDYVYLTDCYFFDVKSKKGVYWGGYIRSFNKGKGAGIGRLISARLLNKIDWICWPPGYDKLLDTAFDKQIDRAQCSKVGINIKQSGLFAIDIKSSENMTPFDLWENSVFVNGKDLLFNNLPKQLAETIYENKPPQRPQKPG